MTAHDRGACAPAGHGPIRTTASLLINVSTLLQEPIGSLRRFEIDRARGDGPPAPVSGTLRLLRTDQSLLATAELTTSVTDLCGSCLNDLVLELDVDFDEEFWPHVDAITGMALDPPPERSGFSVVDGQIDLSEAVRQYVEMSRPMSPRCAEDCPGMEIEEPSEEPADPRWAALATLKLTTEGD